LKRWNRDVVDPPLKALIKDGMSAEEAMAALNEKFGGAAQEAAGTTAGQFKRASLAFAERQESERLLRPSLINKV